MESLLPASLQGFAPLLLLAGLIAGPKVIRRAREVRQRFALARAAAAQQDPEASRAAFQRLAGVTVLALALSVALIRFCRPSQDIFADNGLSILGSPTSHLAYLLRREPARDPLINLLNSRSGRSTYARFGHDAAMSCSWCAGDDDRWIASAPGTVGFWLASLAVLAASSFGGMGGGRTARKIATWTCTSAALVELWARSDWGPGTWRPGPGEDLVPVDRYVHLGRNVLLAVVLLNACILYLSPPPPPMADTSTSQLATEIFLTLNAASGSQAYLRAIRTAELREPQLRQLLTRVGEKQAAMSEEAGRRIRSMEADDIARAMKEVRGKAQSFAQGGWERLSGLTAAIDAGRSAQ